MAAPDPGKAELELRVDIDPRYANSPVMDRVSGDIYQVYEFRLPTSPWRPPIRWRAYRRSWVIDDPTVSWQRCKVEISGRVRFYKGVHPVTVARIEIPWGTFQPAGPATVTMTTVGSSHTYSCERRSDCFRDLKLEIDVCASTTSAPVVPSYDTHAHSNRPAGLPRRTLTVEESYREAGVCLEVLPHRTTIDDSAPEFATWTDAELHDAMEQHFSLYPQGWPRWAMWGLLAGRHENSGTAGVMFDYGTTYGGPGRAPERQGFAVFREHEWFDSLVAAPTTQAQAAAMRTFLYTWVHEAGHAFNYLHSWNKGRRGALSWMNYPSRYDRDNTEGSFWGRFPFRFDDEELIHLRHGDRSEVIPGGDAWTTGWHFRTPDTSIVSTEGNAPLELLIRSKRTFSLLEPVVVELRLRNLIDGIAIPVDPRLDPEHGTLTVQIQKPGGQLVEYRPITCKLSEPASTLLRGTEAREGEDRISKQVHLTYGRDGFYFDTPGAYLIRALYVGSGDVEIASNTHHIYVAAPTSPEENQLAARYLTHEVGMNLYLGGSLSPYLEEGFATMQDLAADLPNDVASAKIARTVARTVARPFFRISEGRLVLDNEPDPDRALHVTEPARRLYHERGDRAVNIEYHGLVSERAEYLVSADRPDDARNELTQLREDLEARGVNAPVLEDIDTLRSEL